ncbi:MAG: FAD-binding protein [Candidatus Moraniibacteriota bacterium]
MRVISEDPKSKRINFTHGSTNSTRTEESEDFACVDISDLNDVLEVNMQEGFVLVEPNVSLDKLLEITLEYNFIPQVVAEFPGITVGGAINGASLESSSFQYGQFNDTAEKYEVVLSSGDVVTASREENSDLFYGISGSYGTLGLLTLIKLRLAPAKKYVRLTYEPITSRQECLKLLRDRCNSPGVQYVEAILFDKTKGVVISGELADDGDAPVCAYARAGDPWFYLHAKERVGQGKRYQELVPVSDYIFRYNRGAFWMGEQVLSVLRLPHNSLSRFLLNPWMNTRKCYDALRDTNMSQEYFIQDFYVPFDKTSEFLEYTDKNLGIYPLWLCPLQPTQTPQKLSPHYSATHLMIDVGIYGQSAKYLADPIGVNENFEDYAQALGARKMLYAHAYYSPEKFWQMYDYDWYRELRTKYHADTAFPDIWEKVHVTRHKFERHLARGLFKLFVIETLQWKDIGK